MGYTGRTLDDALWHRRTYGCKCGCLNNSAACQQREATLESIVSSKLIVQNKIVELTVGLCSGFFLSMLLIICFLFKKRHLSDISLWLNTKRIRKGYINYELISKIFIKYLNCWAKSYIKKNHDGSVKRNGLNSYLQCGRINNWQRRNGGSVYFIDKPGHVLFHSFSHLLNYFRS